jgi:hypothetical protein
MGMTAKRRPLQVSDNFLVKLKGLQIKIRMKTGNEKSLRELTNELALSSAFEEIENNILKETKKDELKLKMDRRNF